jgi:hypothetical protein
MTGTQSDDRVNRQTTVAGCVLMVVSLAVLAGVALPVVTWRDPESGRPLPRELSIAVPLLAGALCYGIGTGILKIFGVSVEATRSRESADHHEDCDTRPPDNQSQG